MPLNMCQLEKKSRRKPVPGDVFVLKMVPDGLFRYGRVIRADVDLVGVDGAPVGWRAVLIYIYRPASPTKLPIPALRKEELIIAPQLIDVAGWREGYFDIIEHRPLKSEDVLSVHCFYRATTKRYVDADGKPLSRLYEPCGFYGLGTYGAVDLALSKELGFPEPIEDMPPSAADSGTAGNLGKDRRKRHDVEHAVTLCLAGPCAGPFDFANCEDRLTDAVLKAGVGEWEGHEIALDGSHAMIYLRGADADRLAAVILPIARGAGLPKGSYLLKRYGEPGDPEERVEI